jgi:hypothetical protein
VHGWCTDSGSCHPPRPKTCLRDPRPPALPSNWWIRTPLTEAIRRTEAWIKGYDERHPASYRVEQDEGEVEMSLRQEIEDLVDEKARDDWVLATALGRDGGIEAATPLQVGLAALHLARLNHEVCLLIADQVDGLAVSRGSAG